MGRELYLYDEAYTIPHQDADADARRSVRFIRRVPGYGLLGFRVIIRGNLVVGGGGAGDWTKDGILAEIRELIIKTRNGEELVNFIASATAGLASAGGAAARISYMLTGRAPLRHQAQLPVGATAFPEAEFFFPLPVAEEDMELQVILTNGRAAAVSSANVAEADDNLVTDIVPVYDDGVKDTRWAYRNRTEVTVATGTVDLTAPAVLFPSGGGLGALTHVALRDASETGLGTAGVQDSISELEISGDPCDRQRWSLRDVIARERDFTRLSTDVFPTGQVGAGATQQEQGLGGRVFRDTLSLFIPNGGMRIGDSARLRVVRGEPAYVRVSPGAPVSMTAFLDFVYAWEGCSRPSANTGAPSAAT